MLITTYQIPEGPKNRTEEFLHSILFIIPSGARGKHLSFFTKIAGALHGEIGESIEFIELGEKESISISKVNYPSLRLLISFGISIDRLGLWIEIPKEGICHLEAFDVITTLHPDTLDASQTGKRTLWQFMQQYLVLQEDKA